MGWTTQGFQPDNFDEIMEVYYNKFIASSDEYSDITFDKFKGSEEYRHFYAAVQVDMTLQLMFSGISDKIADYMREINYKIGKPTTTHSEIVGGLVRDFDYIVAASMMGQTEANRGTTELYITYSMPVDQVTAAMNADIAAYLSQYNIVGGNVMVNGSEGVKFEIGTPLENGQSWVYRWNSGTDVDLKFRFNVWISRGAADAGHTVQDIIKIIEGKFADRYSMGSDIEPEKYWNLDAFDWAGDALLEYSIDGGSTWSDKVLSSAGNVNYNMVLVAPDVHIRPAGEPMRKGE